MWLHRAAVLAVLTLGVAPVVAQQKQPRWKDLEADNGAIFKMDLNSIYRFPNGTAEMVVYAVEGRDFVPQNMRRLWFDCQGRYRDETNGVGSPTVAAPPRSIVGQFAQAACAANRNFQ